jgi:transcriptional regulator with XRE-family HTH domain
MIALKVGERLKELRGGQTQAEFAQRLGLSQAQYNRYETGKRLLPDRLIEAVAARCGIAPEQVVWGHDPSPAPAPVPAAPASSEVSQAVARLLALLDPESLEDLYFFLKRKTEDLAKRRHLEASQAQEALEILKRQAS